MLVKHSKKIVNHFPLRLVIYEFFSCSTNITRGLSPFITQFHTVYEFQFSNRLICPTWYWVVTKQPPWRQYRGLNDSRGVNSTHATLHYGYGRLKVWQFFFAVYSIWIIKITHSLLVNYRDLPALVYQQWTRNFH